MTYDTNALFPDPIKRQMKRLATSENFDYFLRENAVVISYGKVERGTRTTNFGDLDYWRAMLTRPDFLKGIRLEPARVHPKE